jgi:hypothetical protein
MNPDVVYFTDRERAERCMAANAQTPDAERVHLEMAASYRRKAAEARRRANTEVHITHAEKLSITAARNPGGGQRKGRQSDPSIAAQRF